MGRSRERAVSDHGGASTALALDGRGGYSDGEGEVMTAATDFDFEPAYTASGWGAGIAWRVTGYATEWTDEAWEFLGEPEGYDWATYFQETGYCDPGDDPANYVYHEPEELEDRTRVVAHMIGDDRDFTFDLDELKPLPEDGYCPGCGQTGCGHYR